MSDTNAILIWWGMIFLFSIIFLPLASIIFKKFIDKGYLFAKILGILLSSYLVWFFGSIHLLPFTKLTIFLVLIGWTIVNLWLFQRNTKDCASSKMPWRLIFLEECLFAVSLYFWSFVRATEPSIHGLEKFMDFGFVNSILRTDYFPPLDMWLTKSPDYSGGYFINYYYFGHYIMAFLTKLTGIDSAITYNLMIATLYAFTFALPFSIGINLVNFLFLSKNQSSKDFSIVPKLSKFQLLIAGLLAAFLVALGGNLHTLYVFTSGYPNEDPIPPWKLSAGFYPDRYWYPNATRFIPFTIHEFPIYSFVVADLHGHVSDIPMVLLIIALLLALIMESEGKSSSEKQQKPDKKQDSVSFFSFLNNSFGQFKEHTAIPPAFVILLGILLASMYMTNAWDGLIYMVLSFLVFLYINYREISLQDHFSWRTCLYKTFSASLFLFFFFLLASLPFSKNFRPFVFGVGVLCAPAFLLEKHIGPLLFETGKCQKSPFYQLATLWGFFYFNVLGYLFLVVVPKIKTVFSSNSKIIGLTRTILSVNSKNKSGEMQRKPADSHANLAFFPVDVFILILILVSTLLLIFPEFFYIKDIYPAHYRANTMFKLGYQSFMMLGIVSAYILFRIKYQWQLQKKCYFSTIVTISYFLVFAFLFFLVAIYPYFAISSYYGGLRIYHGLNGLNWLKNQYADDYQAIVWLKENINCPEGAFDCYNQPVIAEANGESYTDYARVSANTGLPTIVGWPVHEWLWRGSYDEAGKRIPEVANIYESQDLSQTKQILQKYNVEYIFLGILEREKYKNLDEKNLDQLGNVVFQSGNTKIYKVKSL